MPKVTHTIGKWPQTLNQLEPEAQALNHLGTCLTVIRSGFEEDALGPRMGDRPAGETGGQGGREEGALREVAQASAAPCPRGTASLALL